MRRRELIAGAVSAMMPLSAAVEGEKYWVRFRREHYYLPDGRIYLNNGSLGVPPREVVDTMTRFLRSSAALETDEYPRWGYETLDEHRKEFADFLGCNAKQIAITHNATEGMCAVAAGLDLKAGDEIVTTDQEHPGGRNCWLEREKRTGIVIREVKIPLPPESAGQLVDTLTKAIGPRTRVLSFSGITTTTGLVMPVREICERARAKGVITVVDGAHMIGQIPLKPVELGCDYLSTSPHKWLMAPAGTGLLYGREGMLDRLYPNVVTGGWDDMKLGSARFMMVGTNNRAVVEGAMAGLRFFRKVGPEKIYARIHSMAQMVRAKVAERGFPLYTPADDKMYGSLVTFQMKPERFKKLFELCRKNRMWIYGADKLRISTPVYVRTSDIEKFFRYLDQTA